jgi:hypothetical protein
MDTAAQLQQPELWPVSIDWELNFLRPQPQKAALYWHSLLNGRLMPQRRELSPRAMKTFITYVNLVDVLSFDGQWDYAVSLQSADSFQVLGNIKGTRFTEIFPPLHAQRWRSSFDLSRENKRPVRLLTRASTRNKNWLACEVFLAPLGENDAVQSIFWVTVSWPANDPAFPHRSDFP